MSNQSSVLNQPHVGIVILNWNGYKDTANCLVSLCDIDYRNYSVLVVDNGSKDGSGEQIDREFPDVQVLFTEENLGFAGGCNVGIRELLEDGVDYILLLNNDTIVEPDFLGPLVDTAERHNRVAAVGSIVRRMDTNNVWSAGGMFRPIFARLDVNQHDIAQTEYETGFISGASLFIPRKAIEKLGMLDEAYFYGFEDQEFAYRAKKNSWSLYINSDSVVHHKVGSSSGEGNDFRFYHATRNRLTFASTHLSPPKRIVFLLFFSFTRLFRIVQWGIFDRQHSTRVRGILLGIWDTILGADTRKPKDFGLGPCR